MDSKTKPNKVTYVDAGFSRFFRRSIDNPLIPVNTLSAYARTAQQYKRDINFDNQPVAGQMADVARFGQGVIVDGSEGGKISVFDESQNQVGRMGRLDD